MDNILYIDVQNVMFCECSHFLLNSLNSSIFCSQLYRVENRDGSDTSVFMLMSAGTDALCREAAGNFEAQNIRLSRRLKLTSKMPLWREPPPPPSPRKADDLLICLFSQEEHLSQHLWIYRPFLSLLTSIGFKVKSSSGHLLASCVQTINNTANQ